MYKQWLAFIEDIMMAVDIGGHNRQQSNWNVWSSSVIQLTLYMYVYILYMSFYPYHCLYAVSLWERMDLAPYFFTYTLVAITCIFCSFSYTTYTITKAKMWPIKNYKKKKKKDLYFSFFQIYKIQLQEITQISAMHSNIWNCDHHLFEPRALDDIRNLLLPPQDQIHWICYIETGNSLDRLDGRCPGEAESLTTKISQ